MRGPAQIIPDTDTHHFGEPGIRVDPHADGFAVYRIRHPTYWGEEFAPVLLGTFPTEPQAERFAAEPAAKLAASRRGRKRTKPPPDASKRPAQAETRKVIRTSSSRRKVLSR